MSESIPLVRFTVQDAITNQNTTTGYALDLYKFKFNVLKDTIPDYISDNLFVWQFGDGDYSTEISPIHWYKTPGKYTVTLTLYGIDPETKQFKSYVNGFTQVLQIYNFVPTLSTLTYGDVFTNLKFVPSELSSNELQWLNYPVVECEFTLFNSWQSYEYTKGEYTLNLNNDNSLYPILKADDYNNNLYLHLSPTDKFLNDELQPINSITVSGVPIYYTRNNNGEMIQVEEQEGATLVGLSSIGKFYYSGLPILSNSASTLSTTLEITLDTTNYRDKYNANNNITTLYNDPIMMVKPCELNFVNTLNVDNITSDIISGIINSTGVINDKFDIYKHKYFDHPINFVFRYGYNINNTFTPVTFIDNIILIDGIMYLSDKRVGTLKIYNSNGNQLIHKTYTNQIQQPRGYWSTKGGYLKGFCIVDSQNYDDIENAYFEVTIEREFVTLSALETPVAVRSSLFNIIKENQINIRKINEDFQMYDEFQKAALQPVLKTDVNLNSYLSAFFGEYDNPNSLCIKPYEKISNWTANIIDIDTCNVESLYNYYYSLNFNISENNYSWPPDFRRVVDLISIPYHKLKGNNEIITTNFDNRGYTNQVYGINKGNIIDIDSYIITAGIPIIAKEKFSEEYTLIDTNLVIDRQTINNLSSAILSGVDLSSSKISSYYYNLQQIYNDIQVVPNDDVVNFVYPLKNYKNDYIENNSTKKLQNIGWGWNLILPNNYEYVQSTDKHFTLSDYYEFYEYIPTNSFITDNIIDWDSEYTTISSGISSLDEWENIKKIYMMQYLYNNILYESPSSFSNNNDVVDNL